MPDITPSRVSPGRLRLWRLGAAAIGVALFVVELVVERFIHERAPWTEWVPAGFGVLVALCVFGVLLTRMSRPGREGLGSRWAVAAIALCGVGLYGIVAWPAESAAASGVVLAVGLAALARAYALLRDVWKLPTQRERA